jgi:hypothetical protein
MLCFDRANFDKESLVFFFNYQLFSKFKFYILDSFKVQYCRKFARLCANGATLIHMSLKDALCPLPSAVGVIIASGK